MAGPRFFDLTCSFGIHNRSVPEPLRTVEGLLGEMKRYGIGRALICHAVAMEHSPELGNAMTAEASKGVRNLSPCWVFLPSKVGGDPERSVDRMLSSGSRVAKLLPQYYFFDIAEWCMGDTLDVLEEHRIPVVLDFFSPSFGDDLVPWAEVVEVCLAHRDLPVIASEYRYRSNRRMYQAMSRCDNLMLDLSGLWLYRGVDSVCKEFGADRLLFGTRLPYRDPSSALGMVSYSTISGKEKAMVAGGNLERLIKGVRI